MTTPTRRSTPNLREAVQAVWRRRTRSILTALGVALGLLALVSTVTLSQTIAGQVDSHFTALMATTVGADGLPEAALPDRQGPVFLTAEIERVRGLNGVTGAGLTTSTNEPVRVQRFRGDSAGEEALMRAMEPATLAASGVSIAYGETFDAGHDDRSSHVALLGTSLADRLGLSTWDRPVQVVIGSTPLTVIGTATSADPATGIDSAIIVPYGTIGHLGVDLSPPKLVVSTDPGAAKQVATEVGRALDPYDQWSIGVAVPPDPEGLRMQVSGDTQAMVLVFAIVALLIGGLGLSNTMLVSVIERRHKIGVRSALGARSQDIVRQIMSEGVAIGVIGGLIGSTLGVDVTLIVAAVQGWVAVVSGWVWGLGIILGALVGAVASIHPAIRSARIDPVEALSG